MKQALGHIRAWWQNPLHFFAALLSLLPALLTCLYVYSYGLNAPILDQWLGSLLIAAHTQQDTLTWEHIFARYNGHRTVFTNLITALFSSLTHWNIRLELAVSLLIALINFLLINTLFGRRYPRLLHWVLLPFAIITFYLAQDLNWLMSFQTQWHLALCFCLLTLLVLESRPAQPLTWLLATGLAFLGTFSMGNGLMIWFAVAFYLWAERYPARLLALWILTAGLATCLYFTLPGIELGTGELTNFRYYLPPHIVIRYVVGFIGEPVALGNLHVAYGLALLSMVVLSANFYYFWRHQMSISLWLALAMYSLGSAVIIALARVQITDNPGAHVTVGHYMTVAGLYWYAVVATSMIVISQFKLSPLLYGNYLVLFVVIAGYSAGNLKALQAQTLAAGAPLRSERPLLMPETCLLNYPLQRDDGCLTMRVGLLYKPEYIYLLAAYRLAIFADRPTVNVLPETYQAGQPIIINSPSPWLNLYIREWMLMGVPEASLLHLTPPAQNVALDFFPEPPQQMIETFSAEAITAFIGDAEQVWYITTPEKADHDEPMFNLMAQAGYIATPYPIQHPVYRQAKFSIYRFQRPPESLTTTLLFGEEAIQLQAWSANLDQPIEPCENIYVQSWWQSEAVPAMNYSLSLVLVAPDGSFLAQKDAAIGDTLMQLWQPGQLYFDERILTLPCNLSPGEYALTLTFYHHIVETNTFPALEAYDPDGTSLGERPVLTTFEVQ